MVDLWNEMPFNKPVTLFQFQKKKNEGLTCETREKWKAKHKERLQFKIISTYSLKGSESKYLIVKSLKSLI